MSTDWKKYSIDTDKKGIVLIKYDGKVIREFCEASSKVFKDSYSKGSKTDFKKFKFEVGKNDEVTLTYGGHEVMKIMGSWKEELEMKFQPEVPKPPEKKELKKKHKWKDGKKIKA